MLPFPLRRYKIRRTLAHLRNLILSLYTNLMNSSSSSNPPPSSSSSSLFDPTAPGIPISYPLDTLEELESRSYFDSFHFPFNVASVPLPEESRMLPDRRRMLVCHDMEGGYVDDKWIQGGGNPDAFAIWHWFLIDVFVYFSHHLITLPPPCWTNAAHKHGVKALGTFITERDAGTAICNKILSTKESTHLYAERLTELAVALDFDGWLLNMENELKVGQIPNLIEFVSHLTKSMHTAKPGSLVIWYDSITIYGDLNWQNQLNHLNKPFFDSSDGIFVNYTWKKDYPKLSAAAAGKRNFDVYMGVDVFGRNTYGGGQWNANIALDVLRMDDVSTALFAPGWVYQTKQPPNFETAQNRWWGLVGKSWGIMQKYPRVVPFHSSFDQGNAFHFSVHGGKVSNSGWNNISCQSFQPFLEFFENPKPNIFEVIVNLKEVSYYGGGNITLNGDLKHMDHFAATLFEGELFVGDSLLHFNYSVKSNGNSLVGLSLEFSSCENERKTVFLTSRGSNLLTMSNISSKYDSVILPHRVTDLHTVEGWVIQKHSISNVGQKLTTIQVVCYNLKPVDESKLAETPKFCAVLGHLTINTPDKIVKFPRATSWVTEGQFINFEEGDKGSKYLSLKIMWKLKVKTNDLLLRKYIIYMQKTFQKTDENNNEGKIEYLGVAATEAYYVSQQLIPSRTSFVKFIIQVWGLDGSVQKLEDCPSHRVDVN